MTNNAAQAGGGVWRPFVVVSHHRSGSNFITDVLRCHPVLQVLKEPLGQHLEVFVRRDLERWVSAGDLADEAQACLARPFDRRYLRDLGRWLGNIGRGFKETRLAEKLDWFSAEVVPLRIIVLVRDPRAVTASILHRPALVEYWIPADQLGYLPSTVDRERASRELVFRSAVIWTYRYTRLITSARRAGSPIIAIERLLQDPHRVLRDIEHFLGVDAFDYTDTLADLWSGSGVGSYSTRRDPVDVAEGWRRALSRADRTTIQTVCGELMDQLGYRE